MISEVLLRNAAARSCAEYVEEFTTELDLENQHEFSPVFERKIKKLVRKTRYPILYHIVQRVAAVALAIVLAGSAWLAIDVEARDAFIGWVKEVYETYFVYLYEGDDMDAEPAQYHLTWVPEGYQEFFSDLADGEGAIVYSNEAGQYLQFSYVSDPNNSNLFIVTDSTTRYEVSVNGYHADFWESIDPEVSSCVVWTDENERVFYVAGFFSTDELIRIAENVERIE